MSSGAFLCLAAALASAGIGLLQFRPHAARKAGLLAFWLASGAAAWALTGSPWGAGAALLLWIVFPVSEMVWMLRRLRIPAERHLESSPAPDREAFPALRPRTEEMEALGFRREEDCALLPPVQDQFYRLFAGEGGVHHGLIGLLTEGGMGVDFAAFSSEDRKGRHWVTWDYPLSYGLKVPPQMILHRAEGCESVADLLAAHNDLLRLNGVAEGDLVAGDGASSARERLERSLARQLQYNLRIGILAPDGAEDGLRYSWRGAFYVASRAVRDLVRM